MNQVLYWDEYSPIYIYGSLIAPLFSFNDYIYDGLDKQYSEKLQIAQNNCLRTCLKCDRQTPRTKLHEDSKIIPLATQRFISSSTIVYQGLNKESTPFINNMFKHVSDQHERQTRSQINRQLLVPRVKLKSCENNIRLRGPSY